MPSDAFIHYLQYCDLDVEVWPTQKTWFDKLPKKLKESVVQQSTSQGPHVLVKAWGVHINEGLDTQAVLWMSIVAIKVLVAPVLGVYIALTGHVQNALAIVGLIATVIVGVLGAWIQVDKGKHS